MSCYLAVGKLAFLRTRALYCCLVVATGLDPDVEPSRRVWRAVWDGPCPISPQARVELEFWRRNIASLPPMPIQRAACTPALFRGAPRVFQDASDSSFGGLFFARPSASGQVAYAPLAASARTKSSAVRVLTGILGTLRAFAAQLRGSGAVSVFSDNQAAVSALSVGSANEVVHEAAMAVLGWGASHGYCAEGHWMRRSGGPIRLCDFMSKALAAQDFRLCRAAFLALDRWNGPHTVDAMASAQHTAHCPRFGARFWAPGAEGVDVFSRSWRGHHVWVYPPVPVVGRCVTHARLSAVSGTLFVPYDTSAPWWPLVATHAAGVCAHRFFPRSANVISRNGATYRAPWPFVAVAFDFRPLPIVPQPARSSPWTSRQ